MSINEISRPIDNSSVIKKYILPIIIFYCLSFFSHWFCIIIYLNYIPFDPIQLISAWTPNISAFFVVWLFYKDEKWTDLFKGWKKWKLDPQWYIIGLSPLLVVILVVLSFILLGGIITELSINIGFLVFMTVIAIFTGATGEELGWRGYLQPRLQEKLSPLLSSILVGLAWGFWHIPLWLAGVWVDSDLTTYLIRTVAYAIIIGWAYNRSNQSVFVASMFHYFINFSTLIVTDTNLVPNEDFRILSLVIYCLYAGFIVLYSELRRKKIVKGNLLNSKNR